MMTSTPLQVAARRGRPVEIPVVKIGTWRYDGITPCEIRIVRSNVLYGTGDYEDPPEVADDHEVECFYILYDAPGEPGRFPAGGGGFRRLEQAVAHVERTLPGPVAWR
ncbi:MAG: hypothetical protein WD229_00460 [Pirellulales bacterium]